MSLINRLSSLVENGCGTMSKKANRCNPAMAIQAMERVNGDKQKGWSEYIRIHFQATGSLSPGCDAKEFYAIVDALWLAAMGTLKRCVDEVWKEDGLSRDGTPMVGIPVWLYNRMVEVVDGHI